MTNRQPAADASALSWSPACARVGWAVRSCDTRRIRGFTGSPLPAPHARSGSQHISIASPRAPSRAALESARKARALGYERSSGPPVGPLARPCGLYVRGEAPCLLLFAIGWAWWMNASMLVDEIRGDQWCLRRGCPAVIAYRCQYETTDVRSARFFRPHGPSSRRRHLGSCWARSRTQPATRTHIVCGLSPSNRTLRRAARVVVQPRRHLRGRSI